MSSACSSPGSSTESTRRLRTARRLCRTVALRLRFADFSRATRSRTLGEPTAQTPTILQTALRLLGERCPRSGAGSR